MKLINKKYFVYLIICLSLLACGDEENPQTVGKNVFKILINFNDTSLEEYAKNIVSLEKILKYSKSQNKDIDENKLKTLRTEDVERDFKNIKEDGIKYRIFWQEIKFLDYTFEIVEREGTPQYEGKLYFVHDDKTFSIYIRSIKTQNKMEIIEIENLKIVK